MNFLKIMSKIECITANYGNKDNDQIHDFPITIFKDVYDKFKDPRRNSRIHKILIHKYSTADITIWIDGNMKLLISPEQMVEKYLGDYDMAVFKHSRDCIYDEAMEVAKLGLDDVELIIQQAKYYEDRGFPKHRGLAQGGIIIRRNNLKTQIFNEVWWADYCRFSRRDQLSLMPAIDTAGLRVNFIPEKWIQYADCAVIGDSVQIISHTHFEGNFNEIK